MSLRLVFASCLVLLVSSPSLAQAPLRLPSSAQDYRDLLQDPRGGPCAQCGVVTAIQTRSHEGPAPRNLAPAAGDSGGLGGNLRTTPILGTGDVVAEARKGRAPVVSYVITVRYLDGSYGFIDEDREPVVRRGDPVRVVEGRVELRND